MVGIKLDTFSGEIPNRDIRLLPESNAAIALNQRVESGALDAVRVPRYLVDLLSTTKYVFRIPTGDISNLSQSYWVQFADANTDVIRTPVTNDSYERHYWASPSTGFKFATKAELTGGGAGRTLVIPRPATAVTLDVIAGTGAVGSDGKQLGAKVTRSYVVSFVGDYGEEGAPSPAAEATGAADQDWRLRDIPQPTTSVGNANISKIRVYRTETAASGATVFNRVVDLSVGTLIYIDREPSITVSGNPQLPDVPADAPPDGIQGIALMPNGVIAGFKGQDLFFSDNYKPHSWPASYTLTMQHPIVGLAVFGTSLIVATQGNPVVVTGASGGVMSMSMSDTPMPCLSKQSIVVSPEGVYWATYNGLAIYTPSGSKIITDELVGRDIWSSDFSPGTIDAVLVYGLYTALRMRGSTIVGFFVQNGSIINLTDFTSTGVGVSRVMKDVYSNRPLLIQDGKLYEWLPPDTTKKTVKWRSKEFVTPQPVNMAAGIVSFDAPANSTVRLRVYTYGTVRFDKDVKSDVIFRLPGGFKSDVWQFEIESNYRVRRVLAAQSVDELKSL